MKKIALGLIGLMPAWTFAQLPDVRVKGDVSLGLASSNEYTLGGKSYTPLGRHSVLTLQALLPIGLKAILSERIQTIKNDSDTDQFDEYYIEDTGSWRIGKQYVPFGGGGFFRQSVLGVRLDSNIALGGVPFALAIVDEGTGKQYGAAGRIGARGLGFSFALGRHWGINSSSLSLVQSIQQPEGPGNGWKQAFGIDSNRRNGKFGYRTEFLVLRQPEGTSVDKELGDFQVTYDLGHRHSAFAGASAVLGDRNTFIRLGGTYTAAKGVSIEGMYRLQDRNFRDFSVFLRFRF